ncbi:hypothetical protein [Micromonospora citrea]|uniref:hypothetical protein n=1 Tax=Micromonospora citrea TaxID=47855 RepID=UPI00159F1350|nr:hypothetical protein [Micromonospora citrea]
MTPTSRILLVAGPTGSASKVTDPRSWPAADRVAGCPFPRPASGTMTAHTLAAWW